MTSGSLSSPPARITLSRRGDREITAIATGEQYKWAHTALAAAGWTKTESGVHTRLFADRASAERAVSALIHFARRHRATVAMSSRPFLGDIADTIAHHLPGPWIPTVEIYSHPVWRGDLVPWVWDSGELAEAVHDGNVPYAATLANTAAGVELLLIERPGHPHGYVIGAFASDGFTDNARDPHAPTGIVLPQDPHQAADAITDRYLPAYHQALHARHTVAVAEALDRIRCEHIELQRLDPSGSGPKQELFAETAWYEFLTVVAHAPPLLRHCQRTGLTAPDAAAFAQLSAALTTGAEIVDTWRSLLGPAASHTQQAHRSDGHREAKAVRDARIRPVIETWLVHGDTLLNRAHAAPGTPTSLPSAAVPALPPAAAPHRRH
ncbi:hypothetical protein ACFRI7_11760 [Streptomyces sp. NPDC056716]|uniref:hypothetical protein n=1 Tax=unclassified Streptomyces TaxID=2593676 RepID=UPI0036C68850